MEYMVKDKFNPDLLKVMQEAETTKESDLREVKEAIKNELDESGEQKKSA